MADDDSDGINCYNELDNDNGNYRDRNDSNYLVNSNNEDGDNKILRLKQNPEIKTIVVVILMIMILTITIMMIVKNNSENYNDHNSNNSTNKGCGPRLV